MWHWTARVALTIPLVVVLAAWAPSDNRVVLGAKDLVPYGKGWGSVEPSLVFNGGVPSGRVWNIRWTDWGGKVAVGRGLNWIYKPKGGYYGRPGMIQLRAFDIGRCERGGAMAYRRLHVRVPNRPGGPLGRWQRWAGWRTICDGPKS